MNSASSSQHSTHNENQYAGMIKQSYFKILRNHFFNLFTYLDSVVPNFFPMHEVVTVWRMIQFIGPCLCAANNLLWEHNKTPGKAVSILSIFFHIVPVEYRRDASVVVEFIYCGVNILFFVIIVASAYYYKKAARLPTYLPSILSVYIHTVGYLIHPINLNLVGEDVGRFIDGQTPALHLSIEILSIVLSLICFAIWFWFFDQISVVSFLFRPNSLLSVLSSTQTFIFITTNIVTFVLAVASHLSKYPNAVLNMVAALIYLVGLTSVYTPGSYINSAHKRLVFSSSISACLFTFIMGIYVITGRKASFIELFILVIVLIVVYLLSFLVLKSSLRKQMKWLDDYHDKVITIDDFKNPNQVVKYGITGMQFAHPACLNWQIFREGSERWPENVKIWVTFGKFVAIYPQENMLLSHIIFAMTANKLSGNLAKQSIAQAKTIYTQRESSLSTTLKGKLNRCNKHVQTTKRKLRHVWDLAIQGSINEMEASINAAYQSVNKSRSYFNHLLSQYPNNRFVARSYLRFILEIEGDPKKYQEWSEKVGYLHRGISINPDRTNLLGIHAFPGLPPSVSDNYSQPILTESESFISDTDNSTYDNNQTNQSDLNDQINVIRDHIDKLRIPATMCIKIWNTFLFFILLLLPAVILLALLPGYINSLSQCLYYEYYLSYLRTMSVEVPVFSNHYLLEQLGFFPKPLFNAAPEAYGYENETLQMLRFLIQLTSSSLESVSQYRLYKRNDEDVKPVHEIVFSGIIPYKNYLNQKKFTNAPSTLQGALSEVAMSAAKLIDEIHEINCSTNPDQCWALMNKGIYLNQIMNFGNLMQSITSALVNMNAFLAKNVSNVENLAMFICLFVCIVYALIIIGILVYQLESLEKCKRSIYKCLTALPKNVVSTVSESLRMMHKNDDGETEKVEETDSELNKQDENILKIFSSSSDASSMKSLDKTVLIICSLLILVIAIVCTCVIALTFPDIPEKLNNNSPHLDFIHGTSGFGFAIIGAIDNLILITNGKGIHGNLTYDQENIDINDENLTLLREYHANYTKDILTTFLTNYHNSRYGREGNTVPPYSLYEDAIETADGMREGCEGDIKNITGVPSYYSCYPANIQINLFKPIVNMLVNPVLDKQVPRIDPNDTNYNQLWNMMTMGVCSKLLFPMFGNIVPEMQKSMNGILPPIRAIVIIILIVAFIIVILIIIQIISSEAKMKFALSLLTQCPPQDVMQTPKIMEILSGNFSSKSKDVSTHNSEFFDQIVQSIPDSVIVCNLNFKVTNINKASERIYGLDVKEFLDKDVQEFITTSSMFVGSTKELFEKSESNIKVEFKKPGDDNKCFLDINLSQMGDNYVLVTRDETQAVLYNTLIAEERAKSDHLLSSILPPNLVKRVQDGEKNISFGVQSASILFLDIVEFTPWCASNTASMVMSTLNALFRKFDADLATHSTMTKIKCIGDCYMCSGGIFVEINQASVHAKETVEFGLEAIAAVEQNNKEMNLSLRIRVGVNTGGPIVAGVLGTDKPTFEILGPAINMAQQMEHHGVPMKVHVSRATYELIYGGNFVIKERGQIEIKKGSVLTYLVESKK